MARRGAFVSAMTSDEKPIEKPDFGVLLGWEIEPAGRRVAIRMQSATQIPESGEDVREYRYFLSREQAAQLADNLFRHAGTTPPDRTGVFKRLFG